jgi:phage-related protein
MFSKQLYLYIQFLVSCSRLKPLEWIGTSREAVRAFDEEARQRIGYQLYRVQGGLEPSDWKPMTVVGSGVREIRVHSGKNEFRAIYVATFEEGVYVLHALKKKSQKTPKTDLELATTRFKELVKQRKAKSK